MKNLFKSLPIAMPTIYLTITSIFATCEFPIFRNYSQLMEKYYEDQCNFEETTLKKYKYGVELNSLLQFRQKQTLNRINFDHNHVDIQIFYSMIIR